MTGVFPPPVATIPTLTLLIPGPVNSYVYKHTKGEPCPYVRQLTTDSNTYCTYNFVFMMFRSPPVGLHVARQADYKDYTYRFYADELPGSSINRHMQTAILAPIIHWKTIKPMTQTPLIRQVLCNGVHYDLVGIAHTDPAAAAALEARLHDGRYDAVAVELCPARHAALLAPEVWGETDLFRILREGRAGQLAITLALGGWQQRLAEQSGVEPGAELRQAIESSLQQGLPVLLLDRDLGVTLKRLQRRLPRVQRFKLLGGLLDGVLSTETIDEQTLHSLREGDALETALAAYLDRSATLTEVVIDERDRYMAARLCEEATTTNYQRVLVLAGEGHLPGISRELTTPEVCASPREVIAQLEAQPPRPRRWRFLPWLIVAIILGGFAFGFSRGADLGGMMVLDWILINGTLSALGAAIAGAHPLTILTAFIAAPWTSLNPMVGASMVAGAAEVYLRKPRVSDFDSLRHDLTRLRGWWRNRVSRTLMVFFLAGLGSTIGTYVAGFRIYGRLMG